MMLLSALKIFFDVAQYRFQCDLTWEVVLVCDQRLSHLNCLSSASSASGDSHTAAAYAAMAATRSVSAGVSLWPFPRWCFYGAGLW